jgi:tetratricopeptide (TPR) repeat protein
MDSNARYGYGALLLSRGHTAEGIATIREVLPVLRAYRNDEVLAHALTSLGSVHMESGRLARAERYFRNAIKVARRGGRLTMLPDLDTKMALVRRLAGEDSEGREIALAALSHARSIGSPNAEAGALMELAASDAAVDGYESAKAALRIYREADDVQGQVNALLVIGRQAKREGKLADAFTTFSECLNLALRMGDDFQVVRAVAQFGQLHGDIGQYDRADELFKHGLVLAEATGDDQVLANFRGEWATLLLRVGRVGDAISLLRESVGALARLGPSNDLAAAQAILGKALVRNKSWGEASKVLRDIANGSPRTVTSAVRASAFRYLTELYSRQNRWAEAEQAARRAVELADESGSVQEQLLSKVVLAGVFAEMEKLREAVAEYELAVPMANEIGDWCTLLVIRSNQAACAARCGELDDAIVMARWAIEICSERGLVETEAVQRGNLGLSLFSQGKTEGAIVEFTKTRELALSINNADCAEWADDNLARVYAAQNSTEPEGQ